MTKVPVPPECLECGAEATLTDGKAIYPHRPDLYALPFWICQCGAYTGCHLGTQHAKGRPAGPATREARKIAHAAFDPLWKRKAEREDMNIHRARGKGYKWLAAQLGLETKHCHIGDMDRETALRAAEICWAVGRPK